MIASILCIIYYTQTVLGYGFQELYDSVPDEEELTLSNVTALLEETRIEMEQNQVELLNKMGQKSELLQNHLTIFANRSHDQFASIDKKQDAHKELLMGIDLEIANIHHVLGVANGQNEAILERGQAQFQHLFEFVNKSALNSANATSSLFTSLAALDHNLGTMNQSQIRNKDLLASLVKSSFDAFSNSSKFHHVILRNLVDFETLFTAGFNASQDLFITQAKKIYEQVKLTEETVNREILKNKDLTKMKFESLFSNLNETESRLASIFFEGERTFYEKLDGEFDHQTQKLKIFYSNLMDFLEQKFQVREEFELRLSLQMAKTHNELDLVQKAIAQNSASLNSLSKLVNNLTISMQNNHRSSFHSHLTMLFLLFFIICLIPLVVFFQKRQNHPQ